MNHLLCLGFGFSASATAALLDRIQWRITGTSRSDAGMAAIAAQHAEAIRFDQLRDIPDTVTHVISSIPPGEAGDPVLRQLGTRIKERARQFQWIAYLSTTGVYGDHAGAWTDEDTPLAPSTDRGRRRLEAEQAWSSIAGLPLHIFRLAGIYGPGRNQLDAVRNGTARRIVKPGQIFSRIHVEDIAGILLASIAAPNPGRAYNCADDNPCPPQDVVACAAQLLHLPLPPEESFDTAVLSPMTRSFYTESKRVSNARVKRELGYQFLYPDYRVGLRALLDQ